MGNVEKITVFGPSNSPGMIKNKLVNELSSQSINYKNLFIAIGGGYNDRSLFKELLIEIDGLLGDYGADMIVMYSIKDDEDLYPFYGYKNISFIKSAYSVENILLLPRNAKNILADSTLINNEGTKTGQDIGIVISLPLI